VRIALSTNEVVKFQGALAYIAQSTAFRDTTLVTYSKTWASSKMGGGNNVLIENEKGETNESYTPVPPDR